MPRACLRLSLLVLIALLSGCASAPKGNVRHPSAPSAPLREKTAQRELGNPTQSSPKLSEVSPVPERCQGSCSEIHRCAAEAGHEDLSELLCALARCESCERCNAKIRSPNGLYRGVFQFSPATWRLQCGPIFRARGLSSCLSKGMIYDTCCATICTSEIISRRGLGDWPACGRKITGRARKAKASKR